MESKHSQYRTVDSLSLAGAVLIFLAFVVSAFGGLL